MDGVRIVGRDEPGSNDLIRRHQSPDVVRRKIPWFFEVVGVVGGVYDTNILIPTLKPFSSPKKRERNSFFDIAEGDDGTNRNLVPVKDDPLNPGPPMRPPKINILRPFPTGLLPVLPVSATPGDERHIAPWIEFNIKH
jgi:hypothetical protein